MKPRFVAYTVIACLGLGYFAGAYLTEPKVEIKTVVETVEVEKIITEVKERIVKKPDGTVIIDRETVKKEDKKTDQVAKQTIKSIKPDWLVGVSRELVGGNGYELQVGRRLLSNVYVTSRVGTNGSVSLGLAITF